MTNTVTFAIDLAAFRKLLDIADKIEVSPNRAAKYLLLQSLEAPTRAGLQGIQMNDLRRIRDSIEASQRPRSRTPRLLE